MINTEYIRSLNANYDKLSDAEKAWVDKVLGTTGGTTNE